MRYNLHKKSCIPAYQNYVPCGNRSCKANCTKDNLQCEICSKWFHYKCVGLSKKLYLDFLETRKTFICSDACVRTLFPFSGLDQIEFLTTQVDSDLHPCKKCKKECLGNHLMDCIQCDNCEHWFHSECANLSIHTFNNIIDSNSLYFCSKKCEMSIFPFSCTSNATQLEECDPLSDFFPCKVCYMNCVTDCIQCDICDSWVHMDCTDLGSSISLYIDSNKDFICSNRCELKLMPFSHVSTLLWNQNLFNLLLIQIV